MALSKIPIVSFLSLSGVVPVLMCLLGHYERRRKASSSSSSTTSACSPTPTAIRFQLVASVAVLLCNLALILLEQTSAQHQGYFWMQIHCFCTLGLVLYGRLADAR